MLDVVEITLKPIGISHNKISLRCDKEVGWIFSEDSNTVQVTRLSNERVRMEKLS